MSSHLAPFTAALVIASAALAGPDWEEGSLDTGDAGALPNDAQVPKGKPPLSALESISGELGSLLKGDDEQDMYLVYITTPTAFSASVNCPTFGSVEGVLDPQVWLFKFDELGLLGTDGTGTCASMGPLATDGTGAFVSAPGLYYIAVSAFDSDPASVTGDIFDQAVAGEVSGPDGVGGSMPVTSWTGVSSSSGTYIVELTGVGFVPCAGDANGDGEVNVDDLVLVITDWGPCPGPPFPCDGDVDGDGDVDVDDLVSVIRNWDECNPE